MSEQPLTAATPDGPISGHVSGDGPALLLLHGGPALSDYMDMLAGETAGWRVVRYQQRGVAPSAVNGPYTVQRHVADAVAVLDELGIEQAVVLGHSWGGHLALHLALAHPQRVAGLVFVDGLGAVGDGGAAELGQNLAERLTPEGAARYADVAARLAGPAPGDEDILESLRLLWPGYYADPASAPPMPEGLRVSLDCYMGTFGSIAEELSAGFGEKLRDVTVPAVFLLGEKSPMPVSQGEQTAALLPAAEVTVVPGAGHLVWHEQPGSVAAALARVGELAGVTGAA
jgi:proline iminopeptidase